MSRYIRNNSNIVEKYLIENGSADAITIQPLFVYHKDLSYETICYDVSKGTTEELDINNIDDSYGLDIIVSETDSSVIDVMIPIGAKVNLRYINKNNANILVKYKNIELIIDFETVESSDPLSEFFEIYID